MVGPTLFILKMATNGIGLVMQNFLRMNTWTDPVRNSGFVENWTVFYWAWWIAYGPFVGLFVTRISRGRRLRDIILGMLSFGTLGAGIFFLVLGNYAMHLDLAGLVDVTGLMARPARPSDRRGDRQPAIQAACDVRLHPRRGRAAGDDLRLGVVHARLPFRRGGSRPAATRHGGIACSGPARSASCRSR